MKNKKLQQFAFMLNRDHVIYFYLFNLKYKIEMLDNDVYKISNAGSIGFKTYHKITNLFKAYKVYGFSLLDCLDSIIICEKNKRY